MDKKLIVTAAPHITGADTTQKIMGRVCIALIPALIASVIVFGINSLEELPETEALSVAATQVESNDNTAEEASEEFENAEPKDYTAPVDSEESDVIFENGVVGEPSSKEE